MQDGKINCQIESEAHIIIILTIIIIIIVIILNSIMPYT